tara:strand:- start:416 stop:664 length:249 start_codon:yes stop_codon:yes gene_type:complete
MIISNTNTNKASGSIYSGLTITSDKTKYSFLKVSGVNNYVTIKNNNSPWKTLGKQFNSFDDAQTNYKNPKLKAMILMADSIL